MSENVRKKEAVTRRQFLKEAGLVVGGAAVSSLALTSACNSAGNGTTTRTTTTSSTPTSTSTATNTATTINTTSLPPAEGFVYTTPVERPPLMPIPGCTTFTATDRFYIVEHMWIKPVAKNIVAIGITEKMSELMDKIYSLYLPEVGHNLTKDGYFGYGEAAKLNVEFVSPVSGTVRQQNNELFSDIEMHVNNDPYVSGWLVTIEMSNQDQLDELLSPQEYTDLNAKVS